MLFLEYVQQNADVCYYKEYINTRPFSAREWHEWLKEHAQDKRVSRLWEKICDILETRLNIGGLGKDLHQSLALLNLKELYGWNKKDEGDLANPMQTAFDDAVLNGTSLIEE